MFKRLVAGSIAGGLLVAATFAGAAAAPAGASSCPGGSWTDTIGRPDEVKPGMTGVALWRYQDNDLYRFRVSEAGRDFAVFTGAISTDGYIVYGPRHLEGGDVALTRVPGKVSFRFTNFGGVDGIDFMVKCASYVKVGVRMNGELVPTGDIVVGGDSAHPDANPFTLEKA
jgi:hypothetical protein